MSKQILVPVDGSALSGRALPFASAIAQRTNSRLILVQAATARGPSAERQATKMSEAESFLEYLAAQLKEAGPDAETHVHYGDAEGAILDLSNNVDLIVMSTHGRSGIDRWLYGSVADAVLRKTEVPVLLIPPHCELWQPRPLRLLIALDGSQRAEAVVTPAVALAAALEAHIILVRVVENGGKTERDQDMSEAKATPAQALEYLGQLRERCDGRTWETEVQVGRPGPALAAAARDMNVDVIAMTTHGGGTESSHALGDVANAALHLTNVPLFFVRPKA